MKLSRRNTIIILALTALFFAFTLLHASWLADAPKGMPKLVADRAVQPVTGPDSCFASANSGYGAVAVGPDVAALQLAAGSNAQALHIRTKDVGAVFELRLARQFAGGCDKDKATPTATIEEALSVLTRPELFWHVDDANAARALLEKLPAGDKRHILIGDEKTVKRARQMRPDMLAFSIPAARKCAADYKGSLFGSVPQSCVDKVMLLTLDDLGFTLWGWPNRFLDRMAKADVRVIIAESVENDRIKGLTEPRQYARIAKGFNGYIWVDKIEELGPALKR
ncbi:MAG: hypothetical protein ACRCY3_06345 [Sphingorhabdus sp.]